MARRSSEHIRSQKKARMRDRGVCQICGSTSHPEAHHTHDVQFKGSASPDDMVTLCRRCHRKAHGGVLDIFVV